MSKQYSSFSFKARQWFLFHQIKFLVDGLDRYFLWAFVTYANDNNAGWRSAKSYAYEMGVSEKTVRRAVSKLKELKILTAKQRYKSDGSLDSNYYVVNFSNELLDMASEINGYSSDIEIAEGMDSQTDGVGSHSPSGMVTETNGYSSDTEISEDMDSQTDGVGSHSPFGMVTETDKYTSNKKNNTGEQSESIEARDMSFLNHTDPNVVNFWVYIKGFISRNFNRGLPPNPTEEDISAMSWVIENFPVNPSLKKDCISICEFVISELETSDKLLNPMIRLKLAAEKHPQGVDRFLTRYKEWRKT